MALLKLQDIGKIYVSEGNVAVGIRGVSLSFDRGEFVAITGKSGSGKSTLLNVISGMDTYEEGELLIEGQSTSHYLQPEWEDYREKYISFIFQDYNIIESFTVLQNVELALMHIENAKQRRERAMELIKRVGLLSHIKQKGSQLSGGQKQRTVIARALAKDSPIILADEPTGNLDTATSKEIIALLKEVSKDKLLIVVTHNFDDFKDCATRHVRIFDGAIESDQVIEKPQPVIAEPTVSQKATSKSIKQIKNGFVLGKSIFLAKPKLSTFLCLLMVVGALGIFLITSLMASGINQLFAVNYMFNNIEGRLVVTSDDGSILTDDEIKSLAQDYGAKSYMRNDLFLDALDGLTIYRDNGDGTSRSNYGYSADLLKNYDQSKIVGSAPQHAGQVVLYVPISDKAEIPNGSKHISISSIGNITFEVSGVIYYYDNNLAPKILFTDEGYEVVSACFYAFGQMGTGRFATVNYDLVVPDGQDVPLNTYMQYALSFEVEKGKVYIASAEYQQIYNGITGEYFAIDIIESKFNNQARLIVTEQNILTEKQVINTTFSWGEIYVSPYIIKDLVDEVFFKSYRQFSLFFENNLEAASTAEKLNANGFIAVPSNTTYELYDYEAVISVIFAAFTALVWVLAIVFLAFFVNLCSARAMESFKGEMAIMRSMGIPVNTIKISMFVRMLIALIPAYIAVILVAILIFTAPAINAIFTYLYAWQYLIMFVGLLILSARVTHSQVKKLFKQSVKKSLKGGGVA